LRGNNAMMVATVIDVVVLKPVDVNVQAIRIDIHVCNEMCGISSEPLPFCDAKRLYFIRDIEILQYTAPTGLFL